MLCSNPNFNPPVQPLLTELSIILISGSDGNRSFNGAFPLLTIIISVLQPFSIALSIEEIQAHYDLDLQALNYLTLIFSHQNIC